LVCWRFCVIYGGRRGRDPMLVGFTTIYAISAYYSETCLNRTLSKLKTCLNKTDLTVPSTKCLCNMNLCKPNTRLNWINYLVPKGFCLDRFYCTTKVVSSNPTHGELYSIQHYVIKFVSNLWQVSGFLRTLWFLHQ